LRRNKRKGKSSSANKGLGSIDAIKSGLQRFYMEHGHFPTAEEIDECPYLCSSRWIHRRYGGLRKLRADLGLDIVDYGKGKHRIDYWNRISKLSIETENSLKKFLVETYGEICVHEEKKYGSLRQRMDFFVYAEDNFAVDVFNTYTLKHLNIIVNIKLRKYKDFPFKLFFVVTGAEFSQKKIDELICKKTNRMSTDVKCLTVDEFKRECLAKLSPLKFNIDYKRTSG
jgi:hypothetical protein